jgi:predicted RND superfamily exporter protein
MWQFTGRFILKYRTVLLAVLVALTALMGWWASQVKLSYDFGRAIPSNHPKYKMYNDFKKKFGEDGNLLVMGIRYHDFFHEKFFNEYAALQRSLKSVSGVEDIISIPSAVNLVKEPTTEKLKAVEIFHQRAMTQAEIDSGKNIFLSLPFYRYLLYNPDSSAWLMGLRINKEVLNSEKRIGVVNEIKKRVYAFAQSQQVEAHLSGLPFIRTELSARIAREMESFLLVSVILCATILLLFFRSVTSMLLSLAVVIFGVLWSLAILHVFGFKITLLTALIPPLIVVIGIPNCIYFLNKFHTAYSETGNKKEALVTMVERMGIVTLFCNLAAAIGFAVFSLTRSEILKEFGMVAGLGIMTLFFISLILIPAVLSFLPEPKSRHTKYLSNPRLRRWLDRLERWSLNHRRLIYYLTLIIVAVSVLGMLRLKSGGYIVDDLPHSDKIYKDLKFFEQYFKGVMPLEILIDTKKKYGVSRNLDNLNRIDSLSSFLTTLPGIARPLSITEGLKFARQAFFEGDSSNYKMPSAFDLPALQEYLNFRGDTSGIKNSFAKLVKSFMDSSRQQARISVNMADVGSSVLPEILQSIDKRAEELFDKAKYEVQLTGTSVTFLEGTSFIINGLKESIFWAFLLIVLCMLYLFRSVRIMLCSLIPNVIPLLITAGIMGWTGVRLKPSTVLIFSVALGIAIDVTIRFLVNYRQDLPKLNYDRKLTVIKTIHSTGISIIYTSLVLIAGFIIFCFSSFGGTQSLGWLTSLTLVTATVTNLVLLPSLLISLTRFKK